jgi:hypothetical protein
MTAILFPPSGIIRNYGVDFFIWFSADSGVNYMTASNYDLSTQYDYYSYIVSPSVGLMQYFDSELGSDPVIAADYYRDECITSAFVVDANGYGGPTIL